MPDALFAGFLDPVHQSADVFRRILDAMSHPGRIVAVDPGLDPPAPLGPAMAAALLTLADLDAPVWLEPAARNPEVEGFLRFQTGAPLPHEWDRAAFAVVTDRARLPALDALPPGSDVAPEQGCTLIVEVAALASGSGVRLRGPGVAGEAFLTAAGLPEGFWTARQALASAFPRGVDIIFTAGTALAALPRSTQVEV